MELTIEYLPIKSLKPYERNTRKHTDYDVGEIAKSIAECGFNDPIGVYGESLTIVEGHGRLLAAKKLGMKEVPCIRLDHMTDDQRRKYAILHNKTAELSAFDFDNLAIELEDLDFSNFDFTFGIEDEEEETEIVEDDDLDEQESAIFTEARIGIAKDPIFLLRLILPPLFVFGVVTTLRINCLYRMIG